MINIEELERLEREEWREHPIGVAVSNLGRVYIPKSGSKKAHYTFGCTRYDGYKRICFNHKPFYIHRLVADCFIPNTENKSTVDHINRNPSDNRIENLRWADYSTQNVNRKKPNYPKNTAASKRVLQIDVATNEIIKEWESVMECARNGFNLGAVGACCNNKYTLKLSNIYKGFKWQYG